MKGTVVKFEEDLVTLLVKNEVGCCSGGGGGCACGGSESVYMKVKNLKSLGLEKGDLVEVAPQKGTFSGLIWVFLVPAGLFIAGWNLTPLVAGVNQPLQWAFGIIPALLAFLMNLARPANRNYPVIDRVLPSFSLKTLALPRG